LALALALPLPLPLPLLLLLLLLLIYCEHFAEASSTLVVSGTSEHGARLMSQ